MSDLAEILAASVRTPVLKWSDGEQMSMAERLDLARLISDDMADEYERSRWLMLSSGQMDLLGIAADFRAMCNAIDHANIDEHLRAEVGRAFVEYGQQLCLGQVSA